MDLGLRGRVAIVTGASKGIGLAIVKALAAEGVRVIAGARDVKGELTTLASAGGDNAVIPMAVDLATAEGPRQMAKRAEELGRLDILVNNVGALTVRLEGFLSVTDEQWQQSLNVNLMSAVCTTRAALLAMLN